MKKMKIIDAQAYHRTGSLLKDGVCFSSCCGASLNPHKAPPKFYRWEPTYPNASGRGIALYPEEPKTELKKNEKLHKIVSRNHTFYMVIRTNEKR